MFEWFGNLANTATALLNQGNPLALASLALITALTEIAVPFPLVQETVLFYVGYQPFDRLVFMAPMVMGSLTAGRLIGSSIWYFAARFLGARFTAWIGRRSPAMQKRVDVLGARLGRRTFLAVTIARLTPGILTASTIASGLFRVNYGYFCVGVVLSSLIADGGYILSGIALKEGFTLLGFTPSPLTFAAGVIIIICLATFGNWLYNRKRRARRD